MSHFEGAQVFTEESFVHGQPELLMDADQTPRVLITWMHGDETLGPRVGHHLFAEEQELLQKRQLPLWEPARRRSGSGRAAHRRRHRPQPQLCARQPAVKL